MFYFGVDYYPEHWPEERWELDARLMAEAGMNVVRLAEFAWSKMEPQDGSFDFSWLDRAIAILDAAGLKIILGTPTASAPPWLMEDHPDAYIVRKDGRRATYGNRRAYCPNSQIYHTYTRRIVNRMADHYSNHPAVIGWQIDNEFGDRCYCETCRQAFQNWLKQKYHSLDQLNELYGTIFWSHVYSSWNEIPVPLASGGSPNPALGLDFARFCSDTYVNYQHLQVEILRERCPQHFVTHNFMGFGYEQIDYFKLAQELDLVAWDNYPRGFWDMKRDIDPSVMALGHATMRGLKCKNFIVMEQQAGPAGWETIGVTPGPGELQLWAYQALAHGADGVLFFRWRSARFGTEQYWHGLLDHDGTPGRRYQEIKRMGMELNGLAEKIAGSHVKARIAMFLSYDSRFAFQIQPNNPQFRYALHFQNLYRAFHRRNLAVDIVAPETDLSNYDLVIVPACYVLHSVEAEKLRKYVEAGGVLLLTPRTGVKDEYNRIVNSRLPGLLAEIAGVTVEDYASFSPEMSSQVKFELPAFKAVNSQEAKTWCELLKPTTAEVAARYLDEIYAGQPAVTVNSYGRGKVIYCGAVGEQDFNQVLVDGLLNLADIVPSLDFREGVEITERWQGEKKLLFLLNHTQKPKMVVLDAEYTSLTRELEFGKKASNTFILLEHEVMVLEELSHE